MTNSAENQTPVHVKHGFLPGNQLGKLHAKKTNRVRLSKSYVGRLRGDFQRHGLAAIEKLRETNVSAYLNLIARLVPQELDIEVTHTERDVSKTEVAARLLSILDQAGRTLEGEFSLESLSTLSNPPAESTDCETEN